jgi:hypothetical protein
MSIEAQILELLIGQKILGDDGKWLVYDEDGNELSDENGVLFRGNPGALLMWPKDELEELLDRLKRYKEMGLGYVRKQRQPDTKARKKRAQIEREQRIIEDDEEVLLTLVAALEMME